MLRKNLKCLRSFKHMTVIDTVVDILVLNIIELQSGRTPNNIHSVIHSFIGLFVY